ncbi:MAG: glutamate-cysteine ligase family protein, partial [Actinomycetota bacterium]|nr:glutamate-cysteine ligase family protein [Actinomycetota bacterium]
MVFAFPEVAVLSGTVLLTPVPVLDQPEDALDLDAARAVVSARALRDGPVGAVGLELEGHLVDLHDPGRRPDWPQVQEAQQAAARVCRSTVAVEPGGQLELSTAVHPDVSSAVEALGRDEAALRASLAELGLGWALLGTDPARPPARVHPGSRYAAMEHWFARDRASAAAAPVMMCATAALQVNVEAGPRPNWAARVARAQRLGPVLVALSASSPMVAGRAT